jgi:protein SCO1/2
MISMLRRIIVTGLALGALAACSPQGENGPGAGFTGTDITGAQYGQSLKLTDHNGAVRTLADYKGKVVTIFFGYTQCPDVCPTNLVNMAEAMRQLGPDSDKVQVLFVTVDPERDTQELLAQYVPAFDPRFVGLLGDAATTAAVAKDFKVFYQKQGDTGGKAYTVDHSTGTYVFDPQGRLRLYVKHGEKPEAVAADIRKLLAGK